MDESKHEDAARRSLRERTRRWVIATGTALALIATVLGFLSDTLGLWEQVRPIFSESTPSPLAPGRTESIPQSVLALPASTMSPTRLPFVAADDETLLVVSQFANYAHDASFNVAGRISEALTHQIEDADLQDTKVAIWPDVVEAAGSAGSVLEATHASLVIWGEYDSGRVRVNFTVPGAAMGWEQLLSTPNELSTIINLDVPRESQALALMALGRLYRDQKDLARAEVAFTHALELEPTSPDTVATLRFYLGYLATQQPPADFDAAIDAYSTVIDLRPEWVNARYNRGSAYLDRFWQVGSLADLDLAIDDFGWVLAARATYAEAYVNRGVAYYARNREGDIGRAIADFDAAAEVTPGLARAYYNRGLAYIRADQPPLWEADLHHTLDLLPGYWPANYALCWGYALDSRPETALPYCEAAEAADDSNASRDARGLVMAQLGHYDEAAEDFERYVAWLDMQSAGVAKLAEGPDYGAMAEMLRAGENPVTLELLAELR